LEEEAGVISSVERHRKIIRVIKEAHQKENRGRIWFHLRDLPGREGKAAGYARESQQKPLRARLF